MSHVQYIYHSSIWGWDIMYDIKDHLIIIINLMSAIDRIVYTGLITPGCHAYIQKRAYHVI